MMGSLTARYTSLWLKGVVAGKERLQTLGNDRCASWTYAPYMLSEKLLLRLDLAMWSV